MNELGVLLAFGGRPAGSSPVSTPGRVRQPPRSMVGAIALAAAWFVSGRVRLAVVMLALVLIGSAETQRGSTGSRNSPDRRDRP